MSREVRMVPQYWQHPQNGHYSDGSVRYVGLFDGARYPAARAAWQRDGADPAERPDPRDYMPAWPAESCTHLMMYETVTEGSPISPALRNG